GASPTKLLLDRLRDRRLSGPRKAGEPQGEAVVLCARHVAAFASHDSLVLLVYVDQDLRNLVPRKLVRGLLPAAEHLPHFGAREEHVGLGVVRTGLARGHSLALVAPEGVLEEQRLAAKLVELDLVEDLLL